MILILCLILIPALLLVLGICDPSNSASSPINDQVSNSSSGKVAGTQSQQANDKGQVASGYAKQSSGSGVLMDGYAKGSAPGSILLDAGSQLNTGIDVKSNTGGLTINGGADLITQANKDWQATLASVMGGASSTITASQQNSQAVVDKVLAAVEGLATSKQTDGTSVLQKYGTAITIAGLGLVGFIAWQSSRK